MDEFSCGANEHLAQWDKLCSIVFMRRKKKTKREKKKKTREKKKNKREEKKQKEGRKK